MELDIYRRLAHLKWVGGKAVKVQRRSTGGYTTEVACRQVRQHSIDLHRVRKVVHARHWRGQSGAVRTASGGDHGDLGSAQRGHRVRSKNNENENQESMSVGP